MGSGERERMVVGMREGRLYAALAGTCQYGSKPGIQQDVLTHGHFYVSSDSDIQSLYSGDL